MTHDQEIKLSRREREIMGDLALGNSRKEISSKRYISPNTAVTHSKNIYSKTGARNLADITRIAIARALGKTEKEIKEAIEKYIIDTSSPLRAVLVCVFISLQILIIYQDMGDLTRARSVKKVAKVVKGKKANKAGKEDFYV